METREGGTMKKLLTRLREHVKLARDIETEVSSDRLTYRRARKAGQNPSFSVLEAIYDEEYVKLQDLLRFLEASETE